MAFVGNVPGTVFIPSAEFLNDSFQANGQPTAANNIVFDGANNTDEQRGSNVGGQTRAANESIAGSADPHQPVRRRVGTRVWRGHQRRHQIGHQPVHRLRVQLLHEQGDDQRRTSSRRPTAPRSRTSARRNGAARSAARSSGTSCTFSAASSGSYINRNFSNTFPARPSLNFATSSEESAWNTHVAHRPSAELEAHVGVPLAPRKRAAVQPARRRPGNADELRRRDRPRSDDGRRR